MPGDGDGEAITGLARPRQCVQEGAEPGTGPVVQGSAQIQDDAHVHVRAEPAALLGCLQPDLHP